MKALQFANGSFEICSVPEPIGSRDEAVIDVKLAGICGTDLAIVSGDYILKNPGPVTLGHEIFGTLRSDHLLDNRQFSKGTRVVTEINVACGRCHLCSIGLRTHCANIRTIGMDRDGGFAEAVEAPSENIHAVPDSVSDREAVFTEPLAAALEIVRMCPIEEGSTLALIGCGRLGLLALQVLKLQRPKLEVAIGRTEGKKLTLSRKLGADLTFAKDQSSIGEMKRPTPESSGYDHVIETTGNSDGLALALSLVRPRGTIHVKSTHGLPVSFDVTRAVVKEVRIQGSRCGPFDQALELLAGRKILVEEMISGEFPLEEYGRAFSISRSSDALKVLFVLP